MLQANARNRPCLRHVFACPSGRARGKASARSVNAGFTVYRLCFCCWMLMLFVSAHWQHCGAYFRAYRPLRLPLNICLIRC